MIGSAAYAERIQIDGLVAKIQSDLVYAKTPWGVRVIGTAKQLHDIRVGDRVTVLLNEDNSVVDVYKQGLPAPRHTLVQGHLLATTPARTELRLWTTEGKKVLSVAPTAVPRFNGILEGSPVTVELNERGQVVDVHKIAIASITRNS
jgi:hypothetical protein